MRGCSSQQDIKVHCREGLPRSLSRKKIVTPFVNKITPSGHSQRPNSTARPASAPWKHSPLMPLLMQSANANMTVMLRARNRYQHHFVVSAPARGWGMARLELGTLTQAVKEHFQQKQLSIISGDETRPSTATSGWDLSLVFYCPHSENHTQPLIFTTWLQVIPSTSTFPSGSMATHTKEMYLCALYISSTILVSPVSLEHQCRSSSTSRVFILSLHFHHCEAKVCSQQAPWNWLKENTGTESVVVVQLFH